jgi:hypothetical protein
MQTIPKHKLRLLATLLLSACAYGIFVLLFTRLFDERWPAHTEEFLPLAALLPVGAYCLLCKER